MNTMESMALQICSRLTRLMSTTYAYVFVAQYNSDDSDMTENGFVIVANQLKYLKELDICTNCRLFSLHAHH
jgi:hypothetical protein